MAGFVQIIEFDTSHIDEVRMLGEKFIAERKAEGGRTDIHTMITADRDHPNHYMNIVEFPSYEIAMENSARPDTGEFATRLAQLCDAPPTFHNLDIVQKLSV